MSKNPMYIDNQKTRICKDLYKPASFLHMVKSVFSVIVIGQSPITPSSYSRRKIH